jgi:hypothetical protein
MDGEEVKLVVNKRQKKKSYKKCYGHNPLTVKQKQTKLHSGNAWCSLVILVRATGDIKQAVAKELGKIPHEEFEQKIKRFPYSWQKPLRDSYLEYGKVKA